MCVFIWHNDLVVVLTVIVSTDGLLKGHTYEGGWGGFYWFVPRGPVSHNPSMIAH